MAARPSQAGSGGITNRASSASSAPGGQGVGPLPGGHQGVGQLAPAAGAEGVQLGLLGGMGDPLAGRLAGPLQGAVHRRRGGVEDAGHLGGREPQHLPEDEHGRWVAGRCWRAATRRSTLSRCS